MAEIIRSADKVRNIYNVMNDINMHMYNAKEGINDKLDMINRKDF